MAYSDFRDYSAWHKGVMRDNSEDIRRAQAVKMLRNLADELENNLDMEFVDTEFSHSSPTYYKDELNNFIIPRQKITSSVKVNYSKISVYP